MFFNTNTFPTPLITPHLMLRPPALKDACEYYNAVTESMNEIRPWLPWAKYYPSITQTEDYIRTCETSWATKNNNNIGFPFWIMAKNNRDFIGNVVLWNINWEIPKFEFGYWLRTSQTHHGYITEAVNAITRYCFLQLGARRLEIRCEKANTRAQMIPKRLNFELEGILRNSTIAVADGRLTDVVLFSRIDLDNLPELNVRW